MRGSPFVVAVTDLLKHHGTQRPCVASGPIAGVALTSSAVPAGADITFDGVLEAIADGSLTAVGVVRVPWVGECRRCLEPVHGEAEALVREVFTVEPIEGETYPLGHDRVDLEPMVRDAALLALPLAPLCERGCAGPDPDAHPVTVEGEPEPAPDPRWSALSKLHFD